MVSVILTQLHILQSHNFILGDSLWCHTEPQYLKKKETYYLQPWIRQIDVNGYIICDLRQPEA